MKKFILGSIGLALCASASIAADEGSESPNLVSTFENICLTPGVDHADRIAKVQNLEGWAEDAAISINIEGLQASRSIGRKPHYKRFEEARQWSGEVDGREAKFVLLSFPEKERFRHACIFLVTGLKNAMPYSDDLKAAFKTFGIKGKSVDLAHYFEYAGKLKPEEHPVAEKHEVHGEIFTRSQAGDTKETTHIIVAY